MKVSGFVFFTGVFFPIDVADVCRDPSVCSKGRRTLWHYPSENQLHPVSFVAKTQNFTPAIDARPLIRVS
jgi:hypothetical protein